MPSNIKADIASAYSCSNVSESGAIPLASLYKFGDVTINYLRNDYKLPITAGLIV